MPNDSKLTTEPKNTLISELQNTPPQLPSIGSNQDSFDMSSSWATTVSHYLLQRRDQTTYAYQMQLTSNSNDSEPQPLQNWVFEALFEMLVQRLEEGHTVIMLEAHDTTYTHINALFSWQQQLLQPLLQPLMSHAESIFNQTIDIDMLLKDNHALWQAAMLQSALTQYEQQILQQRYDAGMQLYYYLISIGRNNQTESNSLSKFILLLNKNPLITDSLIRQKNNSQNHSPIIFHTNSHTTNNPKNITLTLWLHRSWQAEHALAQHITRIKEQHITPLPITLNPLLNSEQQDAIHMANNSALSIITGGPGTGKTFTVAQLVIALHNVQTLDETDKNLSFDKANLALAAPTGKAAQRMQESLQHAIGQAGLNMQLPEAKTIHRLLGIGQGGQPRYNQHNPLSEDIIIVDEASMLGVELANHLVSAIKPKARLILLGDANQLAAVDAGSVLADLCRIPMLQVIHKRLEVSRRFSKESGIGKLAALIQTANDNKDTTLAAVWTLMQTDKSLKFYDLAHSEMPHTKTDIPTTFIKNSLSNFKYLNNILKKYQSYITHSNKILTKIKQKKSIPNDKIIDYFNQLINEFNAFRILTAGHHGRCGDHYINRFLSEQHRRELKLPLSKSPWYHGRPIMILQNNYELGLFNGDIGICLLTEKGRLQVFFENKSQGIAVNMLSEDMVTTAYAMTIHKSQGSEFDHVAIAFDDQHARLLSQELIYTAVTRAKHQVTIFSTESAFIYALITPTIRQTGLALQFSDADE